MSWGKVLTLSASFIVPVIALMAIVVYLTNGINSRIDAADGVAAQDRKTFVDQASIDRKIFLDRSTDDRKIFMDFATQSIDQAIRDRQTFQTSMNAFQSEMRELTANQGRLEGIVEEILVELFN